MVKKLWTAIFCIVMTFSFSFAEFDPCAFNFGTDWDFLNTQQSSDVARNIDYVTIWLNDPSFNGDWHGKMVDYCKSNNKTPVFYAYMIAKASGLGDCKTGGKLCSDGAGWLKNNIGQVKNRYSSYASSIASRFGTDKPTIWLMEPDYFQYFETEKQGVDLSYQQAGDYMGQLIDVIKTSLPNALIAIDISPWIEWTAGRTSSYYGAFPLDKIDFMYTSGGISQANNDKIKSEDPMTWSGLYNIVKKPIIADCGYGTGGGCSGHNAAWDDVNNLKTRIANGVCAITQKCPNGSWGSTISSLNTSLANVEVKSCSGVTPSKYTLTITNPTGGTVAKDPNNTSYASGIKVTLTATPSEGYIFKGWSGAASGTATTVEITMDGNKTVTAEFEQKPANTAVLTVKIAGTGSVTKSPDKSSYDKGSAVTLTAKPSSGISVFDGWSGGGLSGNNLSATITLNSDVTVTATFRDTGKVDTIHIEAESFTEKNGDKISAETVNGITSIGWIEKGNSTTYKVNVSKAGTYALAFRVGTGLDRTEFTVTIDGTSAGTVSFAGTKDNWSDFHYENLQKNVELNAGEHTIKLSFVDAINVDKFVLIMNVTAPVAFDRNVNRVHSGCSHLFATASGFVAQLPDKHGYSTYSLFDCKGRLIYKGTINLTASQIAFPNLSRDLWILRLEGKEGTVSLRTAVVR
ncbi:MAG TPA: carbohydrate-binding protein [Chitinispirillaceae bacterium]|nr:carbohydrate-binding protein [Chitinispirillaceae bacterium]